MPNMLPLLRIFISSPGDVQYERKIAMSLIREELSAAFLDKVSLRVVAWDDPASRAAMPATLTPQQAIDNNMKLPRDCDIVVVILWARIGQELSVEGHGLKDGIRPYWSGTEWEYENAMHSSRATGKPTVLVYRRKGVSFDPDGPDYDERCKQYERVQAFFDAFREQETGAWKGSYSEFKKPSEFKRDLFSDLHKVIENLIEEKDPVVPMVVTTAVTVGDETPGEYPSASLWKGSPFPGLRAFTPKDAPIFFGRDREIDQLLERIRDQRFIAVVGASGSGKSSLVWAGLIPRLDSCAIVNEQTDSRDWVYVRFTPSGIGRDPFMSLAVKLEPYLESLGWDARRLAEHLEADPAHLTKLTLDFLRDKPTWSELLLFIDQFEELLTLVDKDRAIQFAKMLLCAVEGANRIRVVITLRADFYHQAITLHPITSLLQSGSFPLTIPDPIALSEMITLPAHRAGLKFEHHNEKGRLDRVILKATGDEPGSLALMAYTLDELYQRRSSDLLTFSAYEEIGGVEGAIGKRAEKAFNSLRTEVQEALPRVFHSLLVVDEKGIATRQRIKYVQVARDEVTTELINALTSKEYRLLTLDEQDGESVVEVAHEALLRNWPRLKMWIDERHDDFRLHWQVKIAAQDWIKSGKNPVYLWHDDRLKLVDEMIGRLQLDRESDFTSIEQEFMKREFERVIEELYDPMTNHYRRSVIGERLNNLDDRRHGVRLRQDGLPDIAWCQVGDTDTLQIHLGNQIQFLTPFYIARYPVTYVQFKAFLDATDGFGEERWWNNLALRVTHPEEQSYKFDNHPREMVTWYEAVAFCRWLTTKLGYEVRLPTEAEWCASAHHENPNWDYTWGPNWITSYSNTREALLHRTTAVGVYPKNASKVGAMDMNGNVWEWTASAYGSDDDSYDTKWERVICGGSWADSRASARISSSLWCDPDTRKSSLGFRICCSNPVPS